MKKNLIIAILLIALLLVWHLRYLQGMADVKDEYRDYVHEKIDKGQEFFINHANGLVKVYPLKAGGWSYRNNGDIVEVKK